MKEPIRIAQIMGKWLGGGVESFVMNYYRNIDHHKIQFDFICDADSTNIPYAEIEALGGRVIIIPPYQKVISYHKELKRILKNNQYKIVHSHINTLSVFPLYAAKLAGIPIRIAHSHSTSNWKEFKRTTLKYILKPFTKLLATHYFACSPDTARFQFGNKALKKGQVTIINNAIEIEKFKYNKSIRTNIRKELKIPDDYYVIGHVGRFMETKNHSYIIDMFDKIHTKDPKTILLLIGEGELINTIKQKVRNLKLEKNVLFLGQREDINKLYQAMDIFILPSLYEGLGMALIEAETAGLPCIASTKVPLASNLNNNVKYLSLNHQDSWVEEILNERTSKRFQDIQKIEKDYNIKTKSSELTKIYQSLWRNVK